MCIDHQVGEQENDDGVEDDALLAAAEETERRLGRNTVFKYRLLQTHGNTNVTGVAICKTA